MKDILQYARKHDHLHTDLQLDSFYYNNHCHSFPPEMQNHAESSPAPYGGTALIRLL